MFPNSHLLSPVSQEVCNPPAGGFWNTQLGELVLKQGQNYCIECRAEIHKQDPGIDFWGLQMPEDEMKQTCTWHIFSEVLKISVNTGDS